MRIIATLTALAVLSSPLAPLAHSQMQSSGAMPTAALPACDGVYSIVRLVELKPSANIDEYMAALKAHQAWYKKHGYADVLYATRVIEFGSGTPAYSKHAVLAHHYFKPTSPRPTRDSEWDAFIKMYTDAADLKESYYSCVPMAHAPRSLK